MTNYGKEIGVKEMERCKKIVYFQNENGTQFSKRFLHSFIHVYIHVRHPGYGPAYCLIFNSPVVPALFYYFNGI